MAVSNNCYLEAPSLLLERKALNEGKLGIYISEHRTGLGMLAVVAKAVLGRWKGDPYLRVLEATDLRIETRAGKIKVTYDGEIDHFATPLSFRIAPGALKVLRPRAS